VITSRAVPESAITGSDVLDVNPKDLPTCAGPVLLRLSENEHVFVGSAIRYEKCLIFPGHVRTTHDSIFLQKHRGNSVGFVEIKLYDDSQCPLFYRPSFNPDVNVVMLTKDKIADLGLQSAKPANMMSRSAQVVCYSTATKQSSQGKVMFDHSDITELSYFGSTTKGFSGSPYMLGKQVYGMHMSGSANQVNFGVPFPAIASFCDLLMENVNASVEIGLAVESQPSVQRVPEGVDSTTAKWLFEMANGNEGRLFFAELDDENMMVFDTRKGRYTKIKTSTFEDFANSTNTQFETDANGVDQYLVGDVFEDARDSLRKSRGKKRKNRINEGLDEASAPRHVSFRAFAQKPKNMSQTEFDEAIARADAGEGVAFEQLNRYEGGGGLPNSRRPIEPSFFKVMANMREKEQEFEKEVADDLAKNPWKMSVQQPGTSASFQQNKPRFQKKPVYVDNEVSSNSESYTDDEDSLFVERVPRSFKNRAPVESSTSSEEEETEIDMEKAWENVRKNLLLTKPRKEDQTVKRKPQTSRRVKFELEGVEEKSSRKPSENSKKLEVVEEKCSERPSENSKGALRGPDGTQEASGRRSNLSEMSLEDLKQRRSEFAARATELNQKMTSMVASADKKKTVFEFMDLQEILSSMNKEIKERNKKLEAEKALTAEQKAEKRREARKKKKLRTKQELTPEELVANALSCLRENQAALDLLTRKLTGPVHSQQSMPGTSKNFAQQEDDHHGMDMIVHSAKKL